MARPASGVDRLGTLEKARFLASGLVESSHVGLDRLKGWERPRFLMNVVTWRCNARCVMCNIPRRHNPKEELGLDDYRRILEDRRFWRGLRAMNVTGGEPFLRDDLPDLVALFAESCPGLERIAFSTNGMLTDRVSSAVKEVLERVRVPIDVTVSLDGVGEVHDRIRGVDGAFDRVMATVDALLPLDEPGRLHLYGQCTLSQANIAGWRELEAYAAERGFHVSPGISAFLDSYFNNADKEEELALTSEQVLEVFDRPTARDHFIRRQVRERERSLPCGCGAGSFELYPNGDVYLCYQTKPVGNALEQGITEVWTSPEAAKVRKAIGTRKMCGACFWSCDLATAVKGDLGSLVQLGAAHIRAKLGPKE